MLHDADSQSNNTADIKPTVVPTTEIQALSNRTHENDGLRSENAEATKQDDQRPSNEDLESPILNSETWRTPQATEEVDEEFVDDEIESSWFDSDTKSFLVSLLCHVVIIVGLAAIPILQQQAERLSIITATPTEIEQEDIFELITEVNYSDLPTEAVGSDSLGDTSVALSMAPVVADVSEIEIPEIMEPQLTSTVSMATNVQQAVGLIESTQVVKGMTGVGVTGTDGAVDRVTYDILQMLEDGPTLVVWLFDASGSLTRRRDEIRQRFDRIYDELGLVGVEPAKNKDDSPLLTSVIAFGSDVKLLTDQPTDSVDEIRSAVDSVPNDTTGAERTFTALAFALEKYKKFRGSKTPKSQRRNIMAIVVTDERGDDEPLLDSTIGAYRRYAIPVYVLGVPSPFGRQKTYVKYVDPDPNFDQTPSWAEVDQGPESVLPERIHIGYEDNFYDEPVIDSGFGPYALSRLCFETGGIYFTIHPNRKVGQRIRRGQIDAFASNLSYFFDPEIMARYRPDYVSKKDYLSLVSKSPLRQSLLNAGQYVRSGTLDRPRLRFIRTDEARFVSQLSQAQQEAARLQPKLDRLVEILNVGYEERDRELSPRWLASFDLSYGTALAEKVRTESYNLMLASAKQGLDYSNPKNNTWNLRPANEISVGSRIEKQAKLARELLEKVIENHEGTPWALLAQNQLDRPIGWRWVDSYTNPNPPRRNINNNNAPRPPRDDQRRMVQRPPKRPVPKL